MKPIKFINTPDHTWPKTYNTLLRDILTWYTKYKHSLKWDLFPRIEAAQRNKQIGKPLIQSSEPSGPSS